MAEILPLKECPFCGGRNLKSNVLSGYRVGCQDCGAEGPYGAMGVDGPDLWNNRRSPSKREVLLAKAAQDFINAMANEVPGPAEKRLRALIRQQADREASR